MSSHPKIPKTNAARLLEKLAIAYSLHSAPVDEEDLSAVTMAHNLGVPPQCVFKTLVARGDKTGVLMACIPANAELDLKALAAASSNKHVDMVPLKEVRPLTGYVRGGCSPLGGKKAWSVFVDASAARQEAIFVSAGLRGVQLRLAPSDLLRAVHGAFATLDKAAPPSAEA